MSLVPIAALGERYGVSARGMTSIIQLGCIIHRTDYWRERTLDKLGIGQLSVSELTQWVNEGDGVHGFVAPQVVDAGRRVFVPIPVSAPAPTRASLSASLPGSLSELAMSNGG